MGVLEGILFGALVWAVVGVVCYILNWTLFRIGLIRNLMILILGIASAGSVLPLLKDGQREIMVTRARSAGAWIAHRKDSRLLMGLLPFGTICLSAFLNLVLAGSGPQNAASMHPAVLPFAAAVYGFLTPFAEELVYRGIVWHRLRRGFSPVEAALISSLIFGAAHADLRQGIYLRNVLHLVRTS